ncbi:MAG: hypothetical protein AAB840_02470 [Patescibacteria group bacterium]
MEPKFQTSFIPKRSLSETMTSRKTPKRVDLFFVLALVVFLLSLLLSGGVVVYGQYVKTSIDKKAQSLEEAKIAFDPVLIAEFSRLSKKMNVARELLSSHVSASAIFRALSDSTLKSVKFDDFVYLFSPDKITITMKGQARSFSSIALQSDLFDKNKIFKNLVFSNLNLDKSGNVNFVFSAEIDNANILYKNNVNITN